MPNHPDRISPGGVKISTPRGLSINKYVRRWWSHKIFFGVEFRAVSFADWRAGWQAFQMTIGLGWWERTFNLLRWKAPPPENVVIRSLSDQIRETHGMEVRAVDVSDGDLKES